VFQASTHATENVMTECSNVDGDVFLTTIAGSSAIVTVKASALADRAHAMGIVVLVTLFVAIVAGSSFSFSSNIILF
jgi:hypothetical protein